ncbi:hypothetical protein K490DRAFT_66856 [Saccharata proteae CBS 121410]|uniref:Dopey N-terminal domain-containing protein n=1 Tax=Saccharata proteae CBS 121410 TaxID=1314787 RepID=A0A9P4HQZ2_9PEZI|nr:hypothetical protein K490DRAFT_66856 [Saccharata proteae CBS 121410]
MSLDPPGGSRPLSPSSSTGRASPAFRSPRRPIEDGPYKKDKAYRRYDSNVERALALFDTPQQEWADYISFLGRLLKAIQTHPPEVPVIPHSSTVATRLAQCLNPSLPSGVHQKALEVYAYVFSILKPNSLSRDLHLYFPGLSSVLSFASLSVRPAFLSLIETHILAVDPSALRPALKSVMLCLLPGLEEETSEDFERVVQIVDKLRYAVGGTQGRTNDGAGDAQDSYFWQCFFLAAITNAPRRQGALAYLIRRLPKFGLQSGRRGSSATDDGDEFGSLSLAAEATIAPEPGLLIRCFAAGLADPQLLIQRGFLDLLVTHLPLNSVVLQERIDGRDLELLVSAAAGVVARRDMSLNRRLWTWFLGPEPTAEDESSELKSPTMDPSSQHAAYFSHFGLQPLTNGIMAMIRRGKNSPAAQAKPFRICLSLMDRWEVGGLLVPEIFVPALDSARIFCDSARREHSDEVLRSVSIFFDGIESGLIWGKLFELLEDALKNKSKSGELRERNLKLVKFIISRFNIREEEMLLHHIPLVALAVMMMVNETSTTHPKDRRDRLSDDNLALALEIVDLLIQNIPERALTGESQKTKNSKSAVTLNAIRGFYTDSQGNIEVADPPSTPTKSRYGLLREASELFIAVLRGDLPGDAIEVSTRLLSTVVSKVDDITAINGSRLLAAFEQALHSSDRSSKKISVPFPSIIAVAAVMSSFQSFDSSQSYFPLEKMPDLVHSLVAAIWHYLSPFRPKYHVEAVRCLWQLQAVTASDHLVESSITALMTAGDDDGFALTPNTLSPDAGRRFAVLWAHTIHEQNLHSEKIGRGMQRRSSGMSAIVGPNGPAGGFQAILTRPLLLLLDALAEEGTEIFAFVRAWLQDLPSLNRIFDIVISHLHSLTCLKHHVLEALDTNSQRPHIFVDDTRECLYHMQHLLSVLRWSSDHTWTVLARDIVPVLDAPSGDVEEISLQALLMRICVRALSIPTTSSTTPKSPHIDILYRAAVSIIKLIAVNPYAAPLRDLELEVFLMNRLSGASPSLQALLLDAILATLQLRVRFAPPPADTDQARERSGSIRMSQTLERVEKEEPAPVAPPPQLVECLKAGFSAPGSRLILDEWVKFLIEVLPMFADAIFQNLLPLVECLCKQIQATFGQLKQTFNSPAGKDSIAPEPTLVALMNGLEQILATAHDRLMLQEIKFTATKSPEQPQGFFGNMVSGVFASEPNQTRAATANSRLTVLLCFQDTVRICFDIWTWGGHRSEGKHQDHTSLASFGYTSQRMRNRARRILEHLFTAETLECLETLAVIWCRLPRGNSKATAVMSLLNVLNGSSPKHTTPAIFNAVYSRTNPNALDPHRMSTLTSDLAETDLVAFLVDYTKSLEDDAMDEIWPDCLTFLRDVLANPLPHRQILPALLEFTATLAEKVDNTNFGEQRKMRRELGDLFTRLLTATFTTTPMGFLQGPSSLSVDKLPGSPADNNAATRPADIVTVLVTVVPKLQLILVDTDRIINAVTSISTNVIGPTIRAKAFPDNVSPALLDLLFQLTRTAQASKAWKKDIFDAFNDPKFLGTPVPIAKTSWLPIIRQWTNNDKDRMPELLSRLSAPTTAGIMFGVGANSARLEADRKTQLNLRRMAIFILATPEDTFVPNIGSIEQKLAELLSATPSSSPSSATRAEIFMVLRALALKTSPVHMAPLWPIINSELQTALESVLPDSEHHDRYNNLSVLQACKLLDTLITLDPDDFQLHEWLFITDTIDAVYRPLDWSPVALVDEVAEVLTHASASADDTTAVSSAAQGTGQFSQADDQGDTKRKGLLDSVLASAEGVGDSADVKAMAKSDLVYRVLRPFLGQLSIVAFEEVYGMRAIDEEGVVDSLLGDLFDEGGIA